MQKKFKCDYCDSVWGAYDEDYYAVGRDTGTVIDGPKYFYTCPLCGAVCYEVWEETKDDGEAT